MTHPITALLDKRKKRVVGLMSGTSMDGIDAALVEVEGWGVGARVELLGFDSFPYSATDRARVQGLVHGTTQQLCEGSFWLGEQFAQAALRLSSVMHDAGPVDLIGSHGQTVWHHPPSAGGGTASTLQIAEPAVIAARTGVLTVADFRVADVACGGEGAPLVPYTDWLLYRAGGTRLLQNIGGIANVTVVTPDQDGLAAFDNGPGNMMVDVAAERASGGTERMDRDGHISAAGHLQQDLLDQLLDDDYLRQAPPKSTGRERYGRVTVEKWLDAHRDRQARDLVATLVAFTAHAIARSYRDFVLPSHRVDEVLISGGGARNPTLMTALSHLLAPTPVRAFAESGVSAAAKEAVAFAVLAVQAVHGERTGAQRVTGVPRPSVLGKICLP